MAELDDVPNAVAIACPIFPTNRTGFLPDVVHLKQLGCDEEENSNWREPNHPSGDLHYGVRELLEKLEYQLGLFLECTECDSEHDRRHHQPDDVHSVRKLSPYGPRVQIR